MLTNWIGRSCSLGELEPGTCFAYELRNGKHLGLKLTDERAFALLWPPVPGAACRLQPTAGFDEQVRAINNAVVLTRTSLDGVRARLTFGEVPGSLLLSGRDALCVVDQSTIGNGRIGYVNLASGDRVPIPDRYIWFEKWSIHMEGPDDHRLVCDISSVNPAAAS